MEKNNPKKGWTSKRMLSFYSKRCLVKHLYPSERFFLTPEFLSETKSVLDVGCAMGGFFNIFKTLRPNIQYTGIDIIPDFIKITNEKYKGQGIFKIYSGKGSFPTNKKYDLVFASGLLHLIRNWKKMFEHMVEKSRKYILADFRVTTEKSYQGKFLIGYDNNNQKIKYTTAYTVINIKKLIEFLEKFKQIEKIQLYGYERKPSETSKNVKKVWMIFCKCWIGKRQTKNIKEIILEKKF